MVGYEVDPAPAADRNKPYTIMIFPTFGKLPGTGGGGRVPPMTAEGYAAFETSIVMGGPRGNISWDMK